MYAVTGGGKYIFTLVIIQISFIYIYLVLRTKSYRVRDSNPSDSFDLRVISDGTYKQVKACLLSVER